MSLQALIAFSIALSVLYYLCPKRFQWGFLLLASLAYYIRSDIRALPFLLITAGSTWACAFLISKLSGLQKVWLKEHKAELTAEEKKAYKAKTKGKQRILFWIALFLNFGMLGIFKYTNNAIALFNGLSRGDLSPLNLILPLGISFYTFQSIGYLIDIYNGKYAAETHPLKYLLFVSFFPQLIQGPISRFDALSSQLKASHTFDIDKYERGLLLIAWGFFKKSVIADRALPLVEEVFGHYSSYGGAVIAIGVLFYSLQQYCDFSGGIDLVIGIGELFGISLPPNFRRPYFAISLTDFWHRWHISLGNWMRDYVFYPFALSRPISALSKKLKRAHSQLARTLPAAIGNILVFVLVGIWHGLTTNYVLWGLYNGLILAVTALADPLYKAWGEQHERLVHSRGFHLFRILRTFLVVNIGWYFDRAVHASDAFRMMGLTLFHPDFAQLGSGILLQLGPNERDFMIFGIGTALLFLISLLSERGTDVRSLVLSRPLPLRWLLVGVFLYLTVVWFVGYGQGTSGFLYAVF
ncbi:MAG: MBOAT family protein [Clostridia bacterium]|nr:MBOAT family protein [Clostridia bacterium]